MFEGNRSMMCRAAFGLPSIRQESKELRRPVTVDLMVPYYNVSDWKVCPPPPTSFHPLSRVTHTHTRRTPTLRR